MLCQDVKNIILEFAADRQFYVLLEDFSNQIEFLVDIKNAELTSHKFETREDEIAETCLIQEILEDTFKELGVTASERAMWTVSNMYELKFMILRKMPFAVSQKHYEWVASQARAGIENDLMRHLRYANLSENS